MMTTRKTIDKPSTNNREYTVFTENYYYIVIESYLETILYRYCIIENILFCIYI